MPRQGLGEVICNEHALETSMQAIIDNRNVQVCSLVIGGIEPPTQGFSVSASLFKRLILKII